MGDWTRKVLLVSGGGGSASGSARSVSGSGGVGHGQLMKCVSHPSRMLQVGTGWTMTSAVKFLADTVSAVSST